MRGLWFRGLGFRGLGFRGLGIWGLGVHGLRFLSTQKPLRIAESLPGHASVPLRALVRLISGILSGFHTDWRVPVPTYHALWSIPYMGTLGPSLLVRQI